jgi:hypothetical protein
MGYRSDVMVVIYPDACVDDGQERERYEQLKVLMRTTFKELWEDDFGGNAEWIDDSHVLKFDIQNVSWYKSYPDVRRFEDMLSTLNGDPNDADDVIGGYCTEFMRVGEDDNDIERDVCGDSPQYYLRVNCEIVCDV